MYVNINKIKTVEGTMETMTVGLRTVTIVKKKKVIAVGNSNVVA